MEFIGSPIFQEEFDYRFYDFCYMDYSKIKNKEFTSNLIDNDYSKTTLT